jgi:glycosyltransferase involved in cell wall biosynthesis
MSPKVSVCVPTYNGSVFLRECLDSILAQTFSDFELIIVDDKSNDGTVSIANEYALNDSRITVFSNDLNLGLVENWNRCIEISTGEWIKFVFQDDTIAPNCLERMLEESTIDCDLVFCRRNFIFEANVSEEKRKEYSRFVDSDKVLPDVTQINAYEYCKVMIARPWENMIGEPTSSMIRRRAFDRFGKFNPNLIQICDLEFWNRVATNLGITFVRENLASFRVHNESTTAKNHQSRTYRINLDFTILFHDFAFDPSYQNLRAFCMDRKKINLSEFMMKEAYYSWQKGRRIILNQPDERQNIEQAWEEITRQYPRLMQVENLNFSEQIQYELAPKINYLKRSVGLKINILKSNFNALFTN